MWAGLIPIKCLQLDLLDIMAKSKSMNELIAGKVAIEFFHSTLKLDQKELQERRKVSLKIPA